MPHPRTLLACLLALTAPAHALAADAAKPYDGHQLVEVMVTLPSQLQTLDAIGESLHCRPSVGPQTYAIAPGDLATLRNTGLDFRIVADDLQSIVDAETDQRAAARARGDAGFFGDYRTYAEHNAFMDQLVADHPQLVTKYTIGNSLEGRPVYGLRIANLDPNNPEADEASKPGFVINGCQHAREWISPASVAFTAQHLVNNYGTDPHITSLVDDLVFYIIPVVNPDGYIHTFPVAQGGGGQRLWRKNRRDNGNGTFGVDLNRNWSTAWSQPGASSNPSSEVYHGPAPFSEPETTNLADFMSSLPNVKGHLDIHSFSQLILGPWAYSETECPHRETELRLAQDLQEQAMDSLYGTDYQAGLGCDALLYVASGTAPDWSFHEISALSWTYELRDTGEFGFVLPPEQIVPASEESLAGILALADFLRTPLIIQPDLPAAHPSDTPLPVEVTILSANNQIPQPGTETLFYRTSPTASFTPLPLSASGETFTATIPAQPCGSTVELFFTAQTTDGLTATFPAAGADEPLSVAVADLSVILEDDFESDLGWIVGAPDDNATAGIWERANPNGSSVGSTPVQPTDALFGDLCYITGQIPSGDGAGANDVDNGKTTLFSPTLDLTGFEAQTIEISYWRWYSNSAGASPFNDVFIVDISDDGGQTWTNVETVGPSGPQVSGGWFRHAFNPADLVDLTDDVQLRFVASDFNPQALIEAAIDGFTVNASGCDTAPCPADVNGSGTVDLDDLDLVLTNFGSTTSEGDTNGDGTVNLDDLDAVLTAFGTTCP